MIESYSISVLFLLLFSTLFIFTSADGGTTIYVSPNSTCLGDCGTRDCPCVSISDGISAAENYTNYYYYSNISTPIIISCAPGKYLGAENVNLIFNSNNFQLISEGGSEVTFIVGEYPLEGSNVIFNFENSTEGGNLVEGFTIINFIKLPTHYRPYPMIVNATNGSLHNLYSTIIY